MFAAGVVLAEEDVEVDEAVEEVPKRQFKDRLDPLYLTDNDLMKNYRFPRNEILRICEQLEPVLGRRTSRSQALPVHTQVLIALRFLASGTFQNVLGNVGGVSQSTCSRTMKTFCSAVAGMAHQHITLPLRNAGALATIKTDFYAIRQFPNVIGCIDGTHIFIKAPSVDEVNYVNRYNKHSINIQAICDASLQIMNLVVQWPGSTHDSFIWRNSQIKHELDSGIVPSGWLLGDSGYPLEAHLLTPVRNPLTEGEERYNNSHMTTRVSIERCFGVLKSRFRCLHESGGTLCYTPERVRNIIITSCVLHNWCIKRNIPLREPLLNPNPEAPEGHNINPHDPGQGNVGVELRRNLIATRFNNV